MKKQKALEDMTHQDLIEGLIYDDTIQDNLEVANDYAPDAYGNHMITIGFRGTASKRKKGSTSMVLFVFNKKGRLVSMEVATKMTGEKHWAVSTSDALIDFNARYGTDGVFPKKKSEK